MEDAIINTVLVIFTIFFILFLFTILFIGKEKTFEKIIQIIMMIITEMVEIGIKNPSNFKLQGLIVFKSCLNYV